MYSEVNMDQITNLKGQPNTTNFVDVKPISSSTPETNANSKKAMEPLKPTMPSIQKNLTIDQAVSKTNSFLAGGSVQFLVDGDKTIVKVVDPKTNQIIRQIPSEEALAIAENLDKLQGMLINSRA
jgi:flagellar protein FlaG